jgi:hypothetical protein
MSSPRFGEPFAALVQEEAFGHFIWKFLEGCPRGRLRRFVKIESTSGREAASNDLIFQNI